MNTFDVISAAIAIIDALIAGSIMFYSRRNGNPFTVLATALAGFFALRAVGRIAGVVTGYGEEHNAFEMIIDLLELAVLSVVLVGARKLTAGLALAAGAADVKRSEYERALKHYSQVVRHRIANPLTIIRGAAQTLVADPPDPATRTALLQAIIESSRALEQVSLAPSRQGLEEHELDAEPHLAPE